MCFAFKFLSTFKCQSILSFKWLWWWSLRHRTLFMFMFFASRSLQEFKELQLYIKQIFQKSKAQHNNKKWVKGKGFFFQQPFFSSLIYWCVFSFHQLRSAVFFLSLIFPLHRLVHIYRKIKLIQKKAFELSFSLLTSLFIMFLK